MKSLNRSAITVYLTDNFLSWLKQNQPRMRDVDLRRLNSHPNMYLFDIEDQNCWGDCFEEHFDTIFKNEIELYIRDGVQWPINVTYETHKNWFAFEYTEDVFDLSEQKIELYDE